jgi:general secretion pathway protein E
VEGVAAGIGASGFGIEEPEDLLDARDEEPIKRLLNNILYQAARTNASDVHVDATPGEVIVRFRVDGVLHTATTLPKSIQRTLINRIKIMSRLDIAQHGLPQDGRTLILIAGRKIDIRVSIMPTIHGEKAVMRLLFQDVELFDLKHLGMPDPIRREMGRLIHHTGGIVLVSGPTGSGKTTTLYAALSGIDHHANNVMTIEDPVEYKIPGYVQTEVNAKLGLTFANALRSVLRQDPDVIMVGEMRDRETALIAIQAALTGHTVFSTVHTNNAPATITRLVDMGIEPYLVSSTVMAVLAQRLVRKVCVQCREQVPADPALLGELGLSDKERAGWKGLTQGRGCPACKGTGYAGRRGLFELLMVTDPIKKVLLRSSEANVIRAAALGEGMVSMRRHGIALIKTGITTVEEVLAATRDE